ncbi:M14 family zinc carboxypeptidase [Aureisphaera galaxeae]|uniref:M14 family zinc carboxypeptidase n=1 Tax=Aureisphaera galaxeae TaxID=1538023 RepID=UPI00234FCC54|nr:M14 family zinc carboxypeptidase [Aureisphaera galaxeae]MDC8003604.1 M14 family zinc carboxypeptidase [Aureisphaera galaxeae]
MKRFILSTLLLFSLTGFAQEVQEIHQRAKIHFNDPSDINTLLNLGIAVDHGINLRENFVLSDFSVSEVQKAMQAGFKVDVLIEDSKAYFLQNNKKVTINREAAVCGNAYEVPDNWNFGSMGGYYTYQEFLDELDDMVALYPDLISAPANIGTFLTEGQPDNSTTPPIGGNPIKWVKISDNPNSSAEGEPKILYNSITHAREPTSLSQNLFFMWYLLENYETNQEVKEIVDNTELYFVPVINPDGYLYNELTDPNGGGFWRKNRKDGHGIDNNRNYDYYIGGDPANNTWGGEGTSSDPNSQVYHGPAPFSEVENQAMRWFCEQHDFVMALNNHSHGDGIFFPFGYTSSAFTPEHDLYLDFLGEMTSRNDYFFVKTNGISGAVNDFMYGTVGTHNKIYSFLPEIGNQFWLPMDRIIPSCLDMMYINIASAKMTNNGVNIFDRSGTYTGDQAVVDQEFEFKRLGLSESHDYTLSLVPVSANIASVGSPQSFNGLAPMEVVTGSIQYTLEAGTQAGDLIVFELVVNNGTYDNRLLVEKRFGLEVPIFYDPGNSTTDNYDTNDWGINDVIFVSAPSSIADSPFTQYANNVDTAITISDPIDLSDAMGASASFFARWDIENNEDYAQFEVSIDNGTTWIPQCGIYTNAGQPQGIQPEGEPVYDGTQLDWVLEKIDLSDYIGENILVRFQLASGPSGIRDGLYFDNLTINIVNEDVLNTSEFATSAFGIYPNPVEDVLSITTSVQNYSIEIYNLQGQLIRSELNNSGSKEMDYSNLASGVYLLKLFNQETTQTFKIVRL